MNITHLKNTALHLDATDELSHLRKQFSLPTGSLSTNKLYFCNNSLGLPLKSAFTLMQHHMQKWSEEGAHAWFTGDDNWYSSLDNPLRQSLSSILGAHFNEVVVMNSLTVNLHLLLTSFYQPTAKRYKILTDAPTFPSDLYAMQSHLRNHGFDSDEALIIMQPRTNEMLLRSDDIEDIIRKEGNHISIVFINAVNYLTGQVFDIDAITQLAHEQGCIVGLDLAHAAGNIPLSLHDSKVDFAVGCSYKYLCSGPGGPGFAFVHETHHHSPLKRLSGWWGNNPDTRFNMDVETTFIPYDGAYSWQVSTPSILAMTPLIASSTLINDVGMAALRKKSVLQTAYLLELLAMISDTISIITPINANERGCQISISIDNAEEIIKKLFAKEAICDFRPPNVIRITPSPLYNTFEDIYMFVERLSEALRTT